MKRILIATVLAFLAGGVFAAEFKGVVQSADTAKNTVTIAVDGKDSTYDLAKDASIVSVKTIKGKKKKTMEEVKTLDSLDGVKAGAQVTFLTDTQDGKEVVSSLKVSDDSSAAEPKKKKKKKKDAK